MTRWGLIKRLAVVTAVLFAGLNYVAYMRLGFAGSLPDLVPLGASVDQILSFRDALGFEGKALYNGTYSVIDHGFICALSGVLLLISQALRPRRFWWAITAFTMIFAASDVIENLLLAQIVNGVPQDLDVIRAGYVNIATRIKYAALLMAGAALITVWRQEGRS